MIQPVDFAFYTSVYFAINCVLGLIVAGWFVWVTKDDL